jgi:hypothetical protein
MKKLSKLTAARAPISFAMKAHIAAALLLAALVVSSDAAGPYIYVANAGEDTVSKIDVSVPAEVARYATWFTSGPSHYAHNNTWNCSGTGATLWCDRAHQGPAPSRIARDSAGDAFVLDRFFSAGQPGGATNAAHLPVLFKIAPSGSGLTSSGSGISAVIPMLDSNGNYDIDSTEITDTAIVWAKSIGSGADITGLGRALGIDTHGNLWVGMYNTQQYYKVDPNTGLVIPGSGLPVKTVNSTISTHTPYGCQVDKNGKLWSVDEKSSLAEIDTTTNTLLSIHPHTGLNYALAVFNSCDSSPVKVYLSILGNKTPWIAYDPQTPAFTTPSIVDGAGLAVQWDSRAIGVDRAGNIVSAQLYNTGRVIKNTPSGANVWDTNTLPAGPAVPAADVHGMIIDDNDDVWVVHYHENQVVKYSGANGKYLATVPVGDQPYTYGNVPPPTCGGTPTPTPTPTPTATPPVTPTATPCAEAKGEARCLPNGGYSYTFSVTNNSGNAMSQILLTPVQGSTFTLSPQLANLPTPLQNGQSTTLTTIIGNTKPGDKVCFFVSLMSDNAPCCTTQVCPTLPRCGVIETVTPPPPARQQRPPPPSRRGKRRP